MVNKQIMFWGLPIFRAHWVQCLHKPLQTTSQHQGSPRMVPIPVNRTSNAHSQVRCWNQRAGSWNAAEHARSFFEIWMSSPKSSSACCRSVPHEHLSITCPEVRCEKFSAVSAQGELDATVAPGSQDPEDGGPCRLPVCPQLSQNEKVLLNRKAGELWSTHYGSSWGRYEVRHSVISELHVEKMGETKETTSSQLT